MHTPVLDARSGYLMIPACSALCMHYLMTPTCKVQFTHCTSLYLIVLYFKSVAILSWQPRLRLPEERCARILGIQIRDVWMYVTSSAVAIRAAQNRNCSYEKVALHAIIYLVEVCTLGLLIVQYYNWVCSEGRLACAHIIGRDKCVNTFLKEVELHRSHIIHQMDQPTNGILII
jgi:hypothetical protein